MLFMSGASLKWLAALAAAGPGDDPGRVDVPPARLPEAAPHVVPQPDTRTSRAPATSSTSRRSRSARAGWIGKGLTNGTQAQGDFLPVQTTDFVFSVLAEELGFLGAIVLFGLFALLIWRVLMAGWRSRDPFGTMFAAGVASMILFQLVVNVGMVIGIMPITGIPLPFVTHGGASLVSMAIGLGILQSINIRQTRAEW